jgi:hypothetical protein
MNAGMMSRLLRRISSGLGAALLLCGLQGARAQDLSPRAYAVTPIHSNAVNLTWSFYSGSIDFNGVLPATDATGHYNIGIFSLYHSLNFFGRSANVVAGLPYATGNFQGTVAGAGTSLYRSGLVDTMYRLSVNLKGGPAMEPQKFVKWKQKMLIGASLKVTAPTGQYDPTKLIGWGTNRWAFKPELGYSQRFGNWIVDAYTGVWFFTTNNDFWSRNSYYSGTRSQTENPVGSVETHLSYDFHKQRLWASFDGNFWYGGATSLNSVENPLTTEKNSRIGVTAAIPLTKHSSIKANYSDGIHVEYGGNYQNVSVSWQYSWLGRPN